MKAALTLGLCAGLTLLLGYPAAGGGKGKESSFDPAKLVGNWTYVSGEKNGEKLDAKELQKQKVIITKDTWTLKNGELFEFKYEVDAKKNPATIKLTMTKSPFGAGMVAQGIIELKGDDLRLCYAAEGDAPKKFDSKGESKTHLFTLKRAK